MKDAVALIGLCLIGAGLWWVYWPIAIVYGGTSLIAISVLWEYATHEERRR